MSRNAASAAENTRAERFLLVQARELQVALPLARVRRVLHSIRVFPIPGSRSGLLGLLQHDGEPVPVIDLACLLAGGDARSGGDYAIIVSGGRKEPFELLALNVHDALSVVSLDSAAITATEGDLLKGDIMHDGARVRVLDLANLGGRDS